MNKNIKLAVAGAVLALSASAANAGIIIPAGEWTLDINGNTNAFYIYNNAKDSATIGGGIANTRSTGSAGDQVSGINTGLLPAWLGVTGKSRQNDLDTEFTISFQPGASTVTSLALGGASEFRQAYFSFGDKSWGTVLVGKDLGQFGRDAILNDMTLLGVGSGAATQGGGGTTTLGRIGTGYMYADFNGQINYTTPNMNGLQITVGIDQPLQLSSLEATNTNTGSLTAAVDQKSPAFVGVARYSFAAENVSGKLWVEGKQQKAYATGFSGNSNIAGIGGNLNAGGLSATAYYYRGEGAGTTAWLLDGYSTTNNAKRDSDGGYVQLTYVLPTKTKAGLSWGRSNLDRAGGEANTTLVKSNEMSTAGLYHPLTKHLNLVGEYSRVESENHAGAENKADVVSLGGILFF
jgi:hypothetical protein